MGSKLGQVKGEAGFTLIELLVVMLVIGILAALVIPSFLSQRVGASDATAKTLANTAEQAALTYNINNGTYAGMTPAALKLIEPSINVTANGQTVLAAAGSTLTGYSVAAVSALGDTFNLISTNGVITRTCSVTSGNGNAATNTGGGCRNGSW